MRGSTKAPAVTELFQQKMLYQTHLRKLEKIREDRKHQLTFDSTRISQQKDYRHNKSKSFAHRYNQQHQQITQSNIKFLTKLEKVRPFTHHSSLSVHEHVDTDPSPATAPPFRRRQQEQTEKENARIYMRMKSVSSSLSRDKLLKDYAKSQQIKTRIARFATQNNKISLKSQQFVPSEKDHLASHYKPKEILKNRIDNRERSHLARQKLKEDQKAERESSSRVFATEPEKIANIRGRKKIYI